MAAAADVNPHSIGIGGLNVNSLWAKEGAKVPLVKKKIRKHNLDILVIGESRMGENLPPCIPEFTYALQNRKFTKRADGGLVVYIKNSITYEVHSDWEWRKNNTQFLEISITEPTKFDLVAIYSPSRDGHVHEQYVMDLMRFFLVRNRAQNTPVMFVGDLNINFNDTTKKIKNQMEEFKHVYLTRLLVTAPTHGKNCIDHIITNIAEENMIPVTPNVVDASDIADHDLVLCRVKYPKHEVKCINISLLKSWRDPDIRPDTIKEMIIPGQQKCVVTKLYDFDKPIKKIDSFIGKHVFKAETMMDKPIHLKVCERCMRKASVCLVFDEKENVNEILTTATKLTYRLRNINNAKYVGPEITLAILHSGPLSQYSSVNYLGGDKLFLKCTPKQLFSGDMFLYGFLGDLLCKNC